MNPISQRQQGQSADWSTPKINLGSSLARGVSDEVALMNQKAKGKKKLSLKRFTAARRISDILAQLPQIPESRRLSHERAQQLQGVLNKDQIKDGLRHWRMQLKEANYHHISEVKVSWCAEQRR